MKLSIVFLMLFSFFFVGCYDSKKEIDVAGLEKTVLEIERSFKLKPADNPNIDGYQPWVFSGFDVTVWLNRQIFTTESDPEFSPWLDKTYFVLEYDSAVEAIRLFSKYVWEFRYKSSSRDCDDFAFAFKTWLQFVFAETYDVEAAAPVAILFVHQKKTFAGVQGGDFDHALIGIATDQGTLIVEPQNGLFTRLETYPNRDYIFYIIR